MIYDVRKIANAILDNAASRGYAVTNMALNKLVYFAHAWYLAMYDRPLIDSQFEAWQYGPVHPQLYRRFKQFDDKPISGRATRIDLATGGEVPMKYDLDEVALSHIDRIVGFYGEMSAGRLSTISHEVGAPWDQVWTASGSRPGMTISDEVTRTYYRSKLKRSS